MAGEPKEQVPLEPETLHSSVADILRCPPRRTLYVLLDHPYRFSDGSWDGENMVVGKRIRAGVHFSRCLYYINGMVGPSGVNGIPVERSHDRFEELRVLTFSFPVTSMRDMGFGIPSQRNLFYIRSINYYGDGEIEVSDVFMRVQCEGVYHTYRMSEVAGLIPVDDAPVGSILLDGMGHDDLWELGGPAFISDGGLGGIDLELQSFVENVLTDL